jgi:type IV secretion system protein VirD4
VNTPIMKARVKKLLVMGATGAVLAGALWASEYAAGWLYFASLKRFDVPVESGTYRSLVADLWDQPQAKRRLAGSGAAALFLVVGVPLMLIASANRRRRELHGSARFARPSEVATAFPQGKRGILVGSHGGRYMEFGGQQFVLLAAPTRSGKGVGVVIPNLLNWHDSTVVLDVKQENWDLTSGFRKHVGGQDCFLFNPVARDFRTHRWNPLAYVNRDDPTFRMDDINTIGDMLFPDQPGTDVIWTATPRALFLGIALYLAETPEKVFTIGQVLRETLQEGDGAAYFARIIQERREAGKSLSDACERALNAYISISSENTRAGVMTSFRSRLELWMNPLVDAATSGNDFDLRELRKRRMSIYVGVPPSELDRLTPLLNLFFKQLINLNTQELPQKNPALKHQVLLLMDEFTALGKLPIFTKAIGFIAGYGLRCLPVIQSVAQLESVYGREDSRTFITNHAVQIVYPPREQKDANEYSEMLGHFTEKVRSEGVSRSDGRPGRSRSESTSEQRRALMLPQELKEMPSDECIVFAENTKPILAKKIFYYSDQAFLKRLKAASLASAQRAEQPTAGEFARIKGVPTQEQMIAAVQRGELAAPVPLLDVRFTQCLASGQVRELRPEDLADDEPLLKRLVIDSKDQLEKAIAQGDWAKAFTLMGADLGELV